MNLRKLGRTDLAGFRNLPGHHDLWPADRTGRRLRADGLCRLEQGVNFFDTAELYSIPPRAETYGATETIIGAWLKQRGKRDDIILATKIVGRSTSPWFRGGEPARLDRKNIFHAIEGSLKRLGTDYVDLYQLHWPDRPMALFDGMSNAYRDRGGPDGVSFEETLGAHAGTGRARQDPPFRPVQRDALGRQPLSERRRPQARPARGLHPERLQSAQPPVRNRPRRIRLPRAGRAAGLFPAGARLSHRQISPWRSPGRRPHHPVPPGPAL